MLKQLLEPFRQQKIDLSEAERVTDERQNQKYGIGKRRCVKSSLTYWREKWMLLLVTVMVALSSGFAILGPYMIGTTVDEYIAVQEMSGINRMLFWLFLVYLGYSIAMFCMHFS